MSIVFDPFTGQIIDTGANPSLTIGGPVSGADANSVLVVDASLNLQDITMPVDGQLLIGSSGNLPVAATLTQASANQVVITNAAGSITLGLPQDISTTDSPEFANVYLSPNGSFDLNAAGTLNIGATATTINIGNGVTPGNVNLYGSTFYQNVTNLEVTDKNILLNKNGGPASGFDSGISIEENGLTAAYAQISGDRDSWSLKAPNTAGIATITPGIAGITLDESTSDLLPLNGSRAMTGNLDMGKNELINASLISVKDANDDIVFIVDDANKKLEFNNVSPDIDTGDRGTYFLSTESAPSANISLQETYITNYNNTQKTNTWADFYNFYENEHLGPGTFNKNPYLLLQVEEYDNQLYSVLQNKIQNISNNYFTTGTVIANEDWNRDAYTYFSSFTTYNGSNGSKMLGFELLTSDYNSNLYANLDTLAANFNEEQFRTEFVGDFSDYQNDLFTDIQFKTFYNINTGSKYAEFYLNAEDTDKGSSYIKSGTLNILLDGNNVGTVISASNTTVANTVQSARVNVASEPTRNYVELKAQKAVNNVTTKDLRFLLSDNNTLLSSSDGAALKINNTTYKFLETEIDVDAKNITNLADPVNPQDAMTLAVFEDYNFLQKEPTGFENRTDSSISFDDGTLTFTIQPTGASYDFYIKGQKFTKTSASTVVIPDVTGEYYIYFNDTGTLVQTDVFTPSIITDNAYVSIVYWNTDTNSHTYFAEERHGLVMDGATHSYLHTVFGARYLSGGALQNFQADGTGGNSADAQFTSDSGSIRDEDIKIDYLAETEIPILYRIGTGWRKKTADSYPVIYSGTAGYTGTNGRLPYNKLTTGSWSLEEVSNGKFVLVHIFATNDVDNPVVGIQGINEYTSISDARTAATTEITTLAGLPFAEFVALGSVIFETATAYTNTPKARVRSISSGVNYVDFRGTQPYSPAYGAASSHSLLSNLSNDDHLQYLNRDGSRAMTGNLDMGQNDLVNASLISVKDSNADTAFIIDEPNKNLEVVLAYPDINTQSNGTYIQSFVDNPVGYSDQYTYITSYNSSQGLYATGQIDTYYASGSGNASVYFKAEDTAKGQTQIFLDTKNSGAGTDLATTIEAYNPTILNTTKWSKLTVGDNSTKNYISLDVYKSVNSITTQELSFVLSDNNSLLSGSSGAGLKINGTTYKFLETEINAASKNIKSVADPLSAQDAATKNYVDGIIPTQTGNNGKFLKTNGSTVSWSTIPNSSLDNSFITVNGSSISLGGSATITANTTNDLTVGTGLQYNSGTTFNGSAAKTISIDSTVATLTGTQTLTNKSFDDAITLKQIATPSNPASGYNKLYAKSDNKFYSLDSSGNERAIDAWSSSIQTTLSGSGTITISANQPFQAIEVQGNAAAVTLSNTPFGTSPPADKFVILLIGRSNTDTVTITNNDASNGCLLNGDITLGLGDTIQLMYISSISRYIEISRN